MLDPVVVPNDGSFTGQMHILNLDGDTKVVWDKNDPVSVSAAKASYEEAKKKGYYAYRVVKGEKDTRIMVQEFNPNEEMMILAPQVVGG